MISEDTLSKNQRPYSMRLQYSTLRMLLYIRNSIMYIEFSFIYYCHGGRIKLNKNRWEMKMTVDGLVRHSMRDR